MAGVPVGDDQIVISKKEYQTLRENDRFLDALEAAGVDNWEGYDIACRFFNGDEDPEDY